MAKSATKAKLERGKNHSHATPATTLMRSVGLYGLGGAFFTHVFGWDLTTLLAVSGVLGVAFTLLKMVIIEIEEGANG